MASLIVLLVIVAFGYGVLRLIEFLLVRAWRHWRTRRRGEEVVRITGGADEGPARPRPQLGREQPDDKDEA